MAPPRLTALRPRLLLLTLAVATAVLSAALPAAARAETARGAQMHPLWWGVTTEDFDRELDLLKGTGADSVRIDLSWASLETAGRGSYSPWFVQKADTFLDHAQARGIKVIGTFWATPCWASSAPAELKQNCSGAWWDRGVDRYPPSNPADYAAAAQWVARRWGSRLHALEVWNEPNEANQSFLKSPDPAAAYAQILRSAYPAVKAAAPALPVLAGSTSFNDRVFLQRLYDLGMRGNHDGIAIHPYNENRDPDDARRAGFEKWTYRSGVPWIRDLMVANGEADKGIWLTELGWSTCTRDDGWCVSAANQAEYVGDAVRIARDWSYVKALIFYNLRDKSGDLADREGQFGLVRRDFSPKPSYGALKAALGGSAGGPAPVKQPRPRSAATSHLTVVRVGREVGRGRRVRVRLRCARAARTACRGRLRLAIRKRAGAAGSRRVRWATVSRGRYAVRAGRSTRVVVRLSRDGQRAYRQRRRLRVRAVVRQRGHARSQQRSFLVRPARRR